MKSKYVIFDLDDTLVYEVDYLRSAYQAIAMEIDSNESNVLFSEMIRMYRNSENVFETLASRYSDYSVEKLLTLYRNHVPILNLTFGASSILNICIEKGYKLGLISDGRSVTQRNKLKALGIIDKFDKIIISEEFGSCKPNEKNFKVFVESAIKDYFYIADNPNKDFIVPNVLGWSTICLLDQGCNIHPQNFDLDEKYLPKKTIKSILDLKYIL